MTELNFIINSKNFLKRTDAHLIQNQIDEKYICHFTFEGEDWENKEKFVTFSVKKKEYTASLGSGNECSSPIPYAALSGCIINISVHCEDIITRNHVALVVSQPKSQVIYECQTQEDYHDVYAETINQVKTKFDNVRLEDNELVFYANGNEVSRILIDVGGKQSNWAETDTSSSQYIQNKPDIINNFRYENDNLICLSDNEIKQSVSLKHNHPSTDVTDFDDEVDIDLNNLLISITENIRSL